MDQSFAAETAGCKQIPGTEVRRGYFGDDHDLLHLTASLDLKYPFPQAHLFTPSLSLGGGLLTNLGTFQAETQHGPHGHNGQNGQDDDIGDPRYAPLVVASLHVGDLADDRRFKGPYGYPTNELNAINGPNLYPPNGDAGVSSYNGMMMPASSAPGAAPPETSKANENSGLVAPIPPLHVQHEISRNEEEELTESSEDAIHSKCSRCKKDFVQRLGQLQETGKGKSNEPKVFKLCFHCRDLQRQRSRRWQKKTKDKQGACRRCGSEIPVDQQRFVLCPQCRKSLRIRKANRAAQGRCVHCSGPIMSLLAKDDSSEGDSSEEPETRQPSVIGAFKVCQRCRKNDKIRRTNLERMGNCNRCTKALTVGEQGKHKVCFMCRQKKKKLGSLPPFATEPPSEMHPAALSRMIHDAQLLQGTQQLQTPLQLPSAHMIQGPHVGQPGQYMADMPQHQNVMVPSMNFMSMEQGAMLGHSGMSGGYGMPQQEMPMVYGQQVQPMMQNAGEMYKSPMSQLPQMLSHMDQGYQQYIGYQPANCNGLHYSSM